MKTQFFSLIIFFFTTFLFSAQCTTLYITEHQSGSPICNLQEGSYIEICGDEVIGCPRNLYVYKKGYQSGSIVYNLTLDQGWTTHYGKLLVNPNTMRLGFEIQGQTAVYSYSTKPMSDERKRELQRKEEEERKQRLQKEEEEKQKEILLQKKYDEIINNAKQSIKDNPSLITQRIYIHPDGDSRNLLNDSIYYFEVLEIGGIQSGGSLTWEAANNGLSNLENGWRLPTINELQVIYYSSAKRNTKWYNDNNIFLKYYGVWSSTKDITCRSFNGFQKEQRVISEYDKQLPSTYVIRDEKYKSIKNIEVMSVDLGKMTIHEARSLRWIQTGRGDYEWRLPTLEELELIYNNKSLFDGLQNKPYLSSSIDDTNTFTFDFKKGKSKVYKSSSSDAQYKGFYIRLVRTIK